MVNYDTQLHNLENQITALSDEVLKEQESHYVQAVEQLKQSVSQLAEDNEFVVDSKDHLQMVDPNCIAGKVSEFARLTELLKFTHLEQETLDNFLRYTISSADLAQLESVNDDRYVSLADDVKTLQEDVIGGLNKEIELLKLNIIQAGANIAEKRKLVNETCLETTNLLEDCWKLVSELDQLNDSQKKQEIWPPEMEDTPIEMTYTLWQDVQEGQRQQSHFEKRLSMLNHTRNSLKRVAETRGMDTHVDEHIKQACASYELLCEFWQKWFLNSDVKNLQVYPQSHRLQFEYQQIEIVIILSSTGISHVDLNGKGMSRANIQKVRGEINKLKDNRDFYLSIKKIIDTIGKYARGIED